MNIDPRSAMKRFLDAGSFAVAGASQDRTKYGNIIFRALLGSGRTVYPLNPAAGMIEGQPAYASIEELAGRVQALSVVTPPSVTRVVVQQAIAAGVEQIWMQPGAEDAVASELARAAGLAVIDDGSCILVALRLLGRS